MVSVNASNVKRRRQQAAPSRHGTAEKLSAEKTFTQTWSGVALDAVLSHGERIPRLNSGPTHHTHIRTETICVHLFICGSD